MSSIQIHEIIFVIEFLGGEIITIKIRSSVLSHAKTLIKAGKYNTDTWDDSKATIDDYKEFAVLIDDTKDAETKSAYSYLIGLNEEVYVKAVASALGYANGARGSPKNPELASKLQELSNLIKEQQSSKKVFEPSIAEFVFKDVAQRLVTGPVLIPGCPDCDFHRGEKIFTVDEVAKMCHAYNNFRLVDRMHVFRATSEVIGEAVENWTLKKDETYTNINGETVTLPEGTWISTVKITDNETWQNIEKGIYKGFSGTFLSNKDAEKLLQSLTANKRERTLIKDLEDPVPVTISIVDKPCVPNAIFTSVKSAKKAGRGISNATLEKIQSTYDNIVSSADNLKKLLDKAKSERPDKEEEIDMDKEKLEQLLNEKIAPITEKVESIEKRLPDEAETEEKDPAIKALEEEIKEIKEQVNKSNDLTNNPSTKTTTHAGRDDSGAPVKFTI